MIEIVQTLDKQKHDYIISLLETIKHNLKEDVSNYAVGRKRLWLGLEWNLRDKVFSEGFRHKELELFCKEIWKDVDVALITYSGELNLIGIKLHRDDTYADYLGYGVNLGNDCKFTYIQSYPGYKYSNNPMVPPIEHNLVLKPGDVFCFNTKNKHASYPNINRWSLNLWKSKVTLPQYITKFGE